MTSSVRVCRCQWSHVRAGVRVSIAAMLLLAVAVSARAADVWTEIHSRHLTVFSNASDSRARNVAWQFEQIRGAVQKGDPLAPLPGPSGGQVAAAPTGARQITVRKRVDPVFPDGLDPQKDSGTVVVEVTLSREGTVASARILGRPSKFDDAAIDAVRQWEFEPPRDEGKPIAARVSVTLRFGR